MKKINTFIFLILISNCVFAQSKKISVNGHSFLISIELIKNEWNTTDTLCKLFRPHDNKFVLSFYKFKDNGGDCNNLFWYKESYAIKNDSLIFLTHYFQKTGLDPIPEWRKQIYTVSISGKLQLVFDKRKYRNQQTWTEK